jgi:hypothetical protein
MEKNYCGYYKQSVKELDLLFGATNNIDYDILLRKQS